MSKQSKKKNTKKKQITKATSRKSKVANTSIWTTHYKTYLPYILGMLALTLFVYLPSFTAEFVNWDDGEYVYENTMISSLGNINELLFSPVAGNHHPLTMFSLAIDYVFSGYEPFGYHVTNVLLHLANVFLVYHFVLLLTGKKWEVAFITATLFGIHPMHVESVAWISERKDVLYTFFFLLSLISYVKYLANTKSNKLILSCLGFFTLAVLSKPAAVVLPPTLVLLDWYKGRNIFDKKAIIEKIPFFIISLIMGIFTLQAQSSSGAVGEADMYSIGHKILFASFGIMMYGIKMILPLNLSTFYPYPPINAVPTIYYIAPFVVLGLAGATFYSLKRTKVIAFGALFFLINIALVIQVLTVGSAIIADRYTYVPYIGLFFMIGYGFYYLKQNNKHQVAMMILGVYFVVLAFMGFKQAQTWKNGETLWTQAVEATPSYRAYSNRGVWRKKQGRVDEALVDYNQALVLNPKDAGTFLNRANIYFDRGQNDVAMADYNKALSIEADNVEALANRGALFSRLQQFENAYSDYTKAIAAKPTHPNTYLNRALTYDAQGRYQESLADYTSYLNLRPFNDAMYNGRGVCYRRLNQPEKSIEDYTKAIQIKPQEGIYYQNRAYAYQAIGNKAAAKQDVAKGQQLGITFSPEFLQSVQ